MSPLDRLDITIQEPKRTFRFEGNVLTISQHFESNQELTETIDGIYFAMPALLSVEFADPPYVQRVSGAVGSVGFQVGAKGMEDALSHHDTGAAGVQSGGVMGENWTSISKWSAPVVGRTPLFPRSPPPFLERARSRESLCPR